MQILFDDLFLKCKDKLQADILLTRICENADLCYDECIEENGWLDE